MFGRRHPNPAEMGSESKIGAQKWEHISLQGCVLMTEYLSDLESLVELSEGRPANLTDTKAGELFDYAERVAADENLWKKVPESFQIGRQIIHKEELRKNLVDLIQSSK